MHLRSPGREKEREQAKKTTMTETGQSETATKLETLVDGQNQHGSDDSEERTEQAKKTAIAETGQSETATNMEMVVDGRNKHGSDDTEEITEQAKKTTIAEIGQSKSATNLETLVEGQNRHGSDDLEERTEQAKKITMEETGQSKTAMNLETVVEGQNKHGSDDSEERTELAKKTTMEETGQLKTATNLETVVEGQNKHGSDDSEESADKLPLLMIYNWTKTCGINILSLCDSSGLLLDHHYTVDEKRYRIERRIFIGADLLASKNGWLLLKNCDRPFLYNPFTRELINLPNLDIGSDKATLSTMSTSAECMVFVIKRSMTGDKIIISTYHCGDTEWSTYTFEGLFNCVKDVVYSKGNFYCVFCDGMLGAFCVKQHDWSFLTGSQLMLEKSSQYEFHLVESEGDLILVYFGNPLLVFRFDWLVMAWVKEDTLGNRAIFINKTSSYAVSAAAGEARNLADRIYYRGFTHTWFYAMETGNHQCSELYPIDYKTRRQRVWIDPPH